MDWVKHTMTDRVSGITGVTLSDTRPTQLARHWSNVLGMPVKDRDGTPVIETPNAVLKFAECDHQESAGLTAIDLAVGDPATILTRSMEQGTDHTGHGLKLCGVEILLR